MTVLWARHGQNQANLSRQLSHRWLDLDLTADGRKQADRLAIALVARLSESNEPPALFCSPLRRARQTAKAIAVRFNTPIAELDELREVNVGDLDGRSDAQAWAIYDSVLTDWRHGKPARRFPGGENKHELEQRLDTALGHIARHTPGRTAVVIAHGANLRAALPGLAGVPDPGCDLDTGQLVELRVTPTATGNEIQLVIWRSQGGSPSQ